MSPRRLKPERQTGGKGSRLKTNRGELIERAPPKTNPILFRGERKVGCDSFDRHFKHQIDFGLGAAILDKAMFATSKKASSLRILAKLLAIFAHQRFAPGLAKIDMPARQIGNS